MGSEYSAKDVAVQHLQGQSMELRMQLYNISFHLMGSEYGAKDVAVQHLPPLDGVRVWS